MLMADANAPDRAIRFHTNPCLVFAGTQQAEPCLPQDLTELVISDGHPSQPQNRPHPLWTAQREKEAGIRKA